MDDQLYRDIIGCENRIDLLLAAKQSVDGLVMEFGVHTGGTIRKIANAFQGRKVYGFDGFEGLPENWNTLLAGHFSCNIPVDLPDNVELIVGWFEDTLPKFVLEHKEPVAFIHIDCDLYSSTKTVFDNLKGQMQNGTIICFDELIHYGGDDWKNHEYKALKELLEETKYGYEVLGTWGSERAAIRILM